MAIYLKTTVGATTRQVGGNLIKGVSRAAERAAKDTLEEVADATIKRMQRYPTKLPKQVYKRTMNLKNSWVKKKTPKGFSITNTASFKGKKYAVYVVGDAQGNMQNQTYHKGRWALFSEVIKRNMLAVKDSFNKKIKVYLGRERISPPKVSR